MKKKLICLLLCLVFAISCLAGCAGKSDEEAAEDITDEASESAMTLAMYLMCDEVPSEDQQLAISQAVNKITKAKFKTQLKLFFYTEAEYYTKLDEAFAARKAAEEAEDLTDSKDEAETGPVEDETFENDWGVTEIKYPEISAHQVDIFYMGGYDNYLKYSEMEMLADLNTELSGASKLINDYVFPEYLSYMKSLNNGMYAIPTNAPVGEYTYLLINKELADKYSHDTVTGYNRFTSPTCEATVKFLDEVAGKDGADNALNPGYVPMYTNLAQYELASVGKDAATKFWGMDENGKLTNSFSILGSEYNPTYGYGKAESYMNIGNILNTGFSTRLKEIKRLYAQNYVTNDASALENGTAAVACIKGGADIPDIYAENYEAVVIANPTFTADDVYRDMFAVTSYSASTSRSMRIITHLNTDVDFRNLILYGIEKGSEIELEKKIFAEDGTPVLNADGTQKKETVTVPANYEKSIYKDVTGHEYTVVTKLNKNYSMPMSKTGNILLAYGEIDEDGKVIQLVKKDYAAKQNSDVVISTTIGFTPTFNELVVNADDMATISEASEEILKRLEKMTYDEYDAKVAELRVEFATAMATVSSTGMPIVPADDAETCTFGWVYHSWADSIGIAPSLEEEEM